MKQDRLEYKDFEADVAWVQTYTGRGHQSVTNSVADWWLCKGYDYSKVGVAKRKELWRNLLANE